VTAVALVAPEAARPGIALRLVALGSVAALAVAVASGSAEASSHRLLAATALPPLLALVLAASVHRKLLGPAVFALCCFGLAAAVTAPALHTAFAAGALAAAAVAAAGTFRGEEVAAGALRDYVTLTKPRIMSLLLVTGACGMVVGARGWPGAAFAPAIVGLGFACGGASALNHVLDRDIDRLMGARTEKRSVASGRLTAARALEFGLALSACSFTLLAATTNLLTAALALAGNLFYVVVYTGYLKRRGPANIVIGGAAGAVPPLVGYAAATGRIDLAALLLFAIVFVWTPPHFWALALLLRDHYAAADVPMLPVVKGDAATVRRIVAYTLALVATTVVPFLTGSLGWLYLAGALALGAAFVVFAVSLRGARDRRRAALVFHFSLLYLALLFAFAAVDAAL
jgi:protoheme IX farnesyltransferase